MEILLPEVEIWHFWSKNIKEIFSSPNFLLKKFRHFPDWKLFPFNKQRYKEGNNNPIFGRFLEYPALWYFIAIPADLVLRFSWTFTLTPTVLNPYFQNSKLVTNLVFVGIVELLELTRRGMWAIFRVENAHVSRRDEFRSYDLF